MGIYVMVAERIGIPIDTRSNTSVVFGMSDSVKYDRGLKQIVFFYLLVTERMHHISR